MSTTTKIVIGLLVAAAIIAILYGYGVINKVATVAATPAVATVNTVGSTLTTAVSTTPIATSPTTAVLIPTVKGRQTGIRDWGYTYMTRGWYDMQNQGVKNDYCRYVGDNPNIWFSCALAGGTNEYTTERIYDPNRPHDPYQ